MSPVPLGILASARVAAGGGGGSMAYVGAVSAASSARNHSISIPLGTASSDRIIIAGISGQPGANITAIALGGTAMTVDVTHIGAADTAAYICRLAVPTGTSGTLTLTTAGTNVGRIGVGVWAVTGAGVALQASGTGGAVDLTALTGDFAISAKYANADTTWTGVTERYDATHTVGGDRYTGADYTAVAGGTISPRAAGGVSTLGHASALYRFV